MAYQPVVADLCLGSSVWAHSGDNAISHYRTLIPDAYHPASATHLRGASVTPLPLFQASIFSVIVRALNHITDVAVIVIRV